MLSSKGEKLRSTLLAIVEFAGRKIVQSFKMMEVNKMVNRMVDKPIVPRATWLKPSNNQQFDVLTMLSMTNGFP